MDAREKAERRERVLAELTELGLELARAVQAEALAADDPDRRDRAAKTFHLISRSVRQSLALEARLDREAAAAAREAQVQAKAAAAQARAERQDKVRAVVEGLIWTESEDEWDAEERLQKLEALLEDEELHETPQPESLDEHVARLCRALGLKVPGAPPEAPEPEPPDPGPPIPEAPG